MLLSIQIFRKVLYSIMLISLMSVEISIAQPQINALDYSSIQEAIDQNPILNIFRFIVIKMIWKCQIN